MVVETEEDQRTHGRGQLRSWEHKTELERSGEQGTRSGGVAEYRRWPVLRQELKGKEEEEESMCL